jgi:hypothetical protein
MPRDFFDDDLLDHSPAAPVTELNPGKEMESESLPPGPANPLMARQKEELTNQVAGAMGEIERLRRRQMEIEREKKELEDLAQKQEVYEQGKQRVIDNLERGCVLLDKEERQAKQMVELLSMIHGRFEDSLDELKAIREEDWADGDFREELSKGLILVQEAESDFQKGMAKVEASAWHKDRENGKPLHVVEESSRIIHPERSFGFWLKAGLAFSLPLILVLVILFVAGLFLNNQLGL